MNIVDNTFQDLLLSADRIRNDVEHHRLLIGRILDGSKEVEKTIGPAICVDEDGFEMERLRSAIHLAILVIEESRKSFKSKRLEALRKHLIDVLAKT